MSEIVNVNVTKVEEIVTINATPNVTQIIVTTSNGGTVVSVNGQTGTVDLTTDDIPTTTNNVYVTPLEKIAITHANRTILDAITEAFTTTLKSSYDAVVSGYNALILTGARLITSAEITKLSNLSGTNTGDQDLSGLVPYVGATQNVDLGEHQIKAGQFEFDQTPTGVFGVGMVRWNDTDGTTERRLKGNNVTLQDGQEILKRVVNKTGVNLLESGYKVVRIRTQAEGGSQGQRSAVVFAQANTNLNSNATLGVVTENIDNNQEGFITLLGEVREINTTGSLQGETWLDGDQLYLSATVAGGLTKVVPASPYYNIPIATIDYAHAVHGKFSVNVGTRLALDTTLAGDNDTAPSVTAVRTYVNAKDALVVHIAGTETITGAKTFSVDTVINGHNIGRGGGNISTNVRIGTNALSSNISGDNNVVFGQNSGFSNNSGNGNAYFGNGSGQSNSIWSNNAYFGNASGQTVSTGGNNAFLGSLSGTKIADKTTNVTNLANSVMLGFRASPLANGQTNQIVIGHDSTGLGSNTTTIGNSSTLLTAVYGNLILGSTADTGQKLQVTGTSFFNGNILSNSINPILDNSYTIGTSLFRYSNVYSITNISARIKIDTSGFLDFQNNLGNNFIRLYNSGNVVFQNAGSFTDIASARLQVNSTTQGFLPPRMTNAQRVAIVSPAIGLIVYCTDATEGVYTYKSTGWTLLL